MNDNAEPQITDINLSKAEIRNHRGLPVIWLIPLIALIIGGWLAYKTISEQGPLISIAFADAEGLEAGKTKIKFKDVIIGSVEEIRLSKDLNTVIVLARMDNQAKEFLTDQTRFWVVRAHISGSEISGLGTLLSGAYISVDPVSQGNPSREFVGLTKRPLVTNNVPGQHYLLQTPTLGSIDIGSPIFYRQIKVGEVVDYNFDQSGEAVEVKIFVHSPHDQRISSTTKFWNASGVDVTLDANGITVDTQSLVSILQGGIAFNNRTDLSTSTKVDEDDLFQLHPDKESATKKSYNIKSYYVMYFDQSVRGLAPGAPVEFRGIPIGEVIDIKLTYDIDTQKARIPVLVMIEPERLELVSEGKKIGRLQAILDDNKVQEHELMFDDGLRAQLEIGNLLTGQLYVDLDIYPDAAPYTTDTVNGYKVFPTMPSPLGEMAKDVSKILKKIENIPFENLGKNLNNTIATLQTTLKQFEGVASGFNETLAPNIDQTMVQLQQSLVALEQTMGEIKNSFGSDSALNFKAQQTLDELTGTIRAVRSVADQLDRNPQSLIFGRGDSK